MMNSLVVHTEPRGWKLILSLFCFALLCGCGDSPSEVKPPAPAPADTPTPAQTKTIGRGGNVYSAQLHLHGPFSEGVASFDSHGYEARDVDVDVLWWSDHDFRIASYHHPSRYGFEAREEPFDRGEAWDTGAPPGNSTKGIIQPPELRDPRGLHEFDSSRAIEGSASLKLEHSCETEEFTRYAVSLRAKRARFRRPLASGLVLSLAVFPDQLSDDAHAYVEITLSEHPQADGEIVPLKIRYILGTSDRPAWREGVTWNIHKTVTPGEWNRIELHLTHDALQAFPEIDGQDNSMYRVDLGVETRRGGRALLNFDDLLIEQELSGATAFDKYTSMIGALDAADPEFVQLSGQEHSYASGHLNEFSTHPVLRDFEAIAGDRALAKKAGHFDAAEFKNTVGRRAIEDVHERDGLVSYNHMFGAELEGVEPKRGGDRGSVLAELIRTRLNGADLLEVGYRSRGGFELSDHFWVWDQLAAHGLFPVGIGVSDSHGGVKARWRSNGNNLISWIYAPSASAADLIEGLRAGAVFFGDITLFNGRMDLSTPGGARMGNIVVSDLTEAKVKIEISGLTRGDRVTVTESGKITVHQSISRELFERKHAVVLAADQPTTVRVGVYTKSGIAKAFSNPIVFVRSAPEGGIAPGRAHVELRGFTATGFDGFHLEAVTTSDSEGRQSLLLQGRGEQGEIEVHPPRGVKILDVAFDGDAQGSWTRIPDGVIVSAISGAGTVRVEVQP